MCAAGFPVQRFFVIRYLRRFLMRSLVLILMALLV